MFGEGDYQLVPSVHACIAKWETPFVIGDGKNLWDATHVENIAFSHVLAVENLLTTKTAAGEAIFIANEEPITFRDFCLAVWANFGHYPPFTFHIPVAIAVLVGIIAEWVTWATGTSTTISRGSLLDAAATRYCSGSKARELLGYRPRVGVEEGLRRSCLVSKPCHETINLSHVLTRDPGICSEIKASGAARQALLQGVESRMKLLQL